MREFDETEVRQVTIFFTIMFFVCLYLFLFYFLFCSHTEFLKASILAAVSGVVLIGIVLISEKFK